MDSTGLIAVATIELNDLLKNGVAIDRENENYLLSTMIVFMIIGYLSGMISMKREVENGEPMSLLYLNTGFIVAFILFYIFGKEFASVYFIVRPSKRPKTKTETITFFIIL